MLYMPPCSPFVGVLPLSCTVAHRRPTMVCTRFSVVNVTFGLGSSEGWEGPENLSERVKTVKTVKKEALHGAIP